MRRQRASNCALTSSFFSALRRRSKDESHLLDKRRMMPLRHAGRRHAFAQYPSDPESLAASVRLRRTLCHARKDLAGHGPVAVPLLNPAQAARHTGHRDLLTSHNDNGQHGQGYTDEHKADN